MMLAIHVGELLSWETLCEEIASLQSKENPEMACRVLCAVALVLEMVAMRWNNAEFGRKEGERREGREKLWKEGLTKLRLT
jgi:hypothetical protein